MEKQKKKKTHKDIEKQYSVTVNNIETEITETERHLEYLRNERTRLYREIVDCNRKILENEAW